MNKSTQCYNNNDQAFYDRTINPNIPKAMQHF